MTSQAQYKMKMAIDDNDEDDNDVSDNYDGDVDDDDFEFTPLFLMRTAAISWSGRGSWSPSSDKKRPSGYTN